MAMLVYQRAGFSKSFSIRAAFTLAGMRDMPGAGSKARCGCAAGSTGGTPRKVVAERLTGINLVQIIKHLAFVQLSAEISFQNSENNCTICI